jgi:hypothetical protein
VGEHALEAIAYEPISSQMTTCAEFGISLHGMMTMPETTRSSVPRVVLCVTALCATAMLAGWSSAATAQQPAQTAVVAAPATPIAIKKDEQGVASWDPAWDKTIEQALPAELLSPRVARAVKPFCSQFKAMNDEDRRAFWAYFFQALSGAEAGLVPTTDVRHTEPEVAVKDTVTKRMVRSEGLLQLTYMDADRYGCAFDWAKDKELPEKDPQKTILQADNNLKCGIRILTNQLIDKHKALATSSSYWSTLRPGTESYRVFVKQMANVPAVCSPKRPGEQVAKASSGTSE